MAVADLPGGTAKVRLRRPQAGGAGRVGHRASRTPGSAPDGIAGTASPLLSLEQLTVHYGPAVAAAVIGGASLFGGRGKMIHALLGGLVIATIYNGMGSIGLAADAQFAVTALVLVAAAAVDALARRGGSSA